VLVETQRAVRWKGGSLSVLGPSKNTIRTLHWSRLAGFHSLTQLNGSSTKIMHLNPYVIFGQVWTQVDGRTPSLITRSFQTQFYICGRTDFLLHAFFARSVFKKFREEQAAFTSFQTIQYVY